MHVRSSSRRATVLRALAVTALTGAFALVPGVALAHPGGHHHPPRHVNQAPDLPTDVRTSTPDAACSPRTPAVVGTATPTLRATLTDPDGDAVRGAFEVRAVHGKRLWTSGLTGAQASGSSHAVVVPAGVLRDGGTYEWRVEARDAENRKSKVVRCRIVVDAAAPGPVTVTPVEGAGALYPEDVAAGGVGVAGAFRFEAEGGVVAFRYAFDGSPAQVDVAPGSSSATVTWVPTTAGTHQLTVAAVDAAGNVGPERLYRFIVESASSAPTGNARWTLDEGAGATASDDDAAHPLTLTPSTTWTRGLSAELAGLDDDNALLLDEPGDGAATSGPVLDTTGSWSVAAFVRPDTLKPGTVVSQDADGGSTFRLGTSTTACEDGVAVCWALGVTGADGAGETTVTSSVPVVAGAWATLFAVRDAASGTVRLDACYLGTVDEPGSPAPLQGSGAEVGAGVASSGPLRLGSAQDEASAWVGAVSGVRTWGGVIDVMQERRLCAMGS